MVYLKIPMCEQLDYQCKISKKTKKFLSSCDTKTSICTDTHVYLFNLNLDVLFRMFVMPNLDESKNKC